MRMLSSDVIARSRMLVAMGGVAAVSLGLAGCGAAEEEKVAPQTEYPAVNKAADDAQIEFMKKQQAGKR